MEDGGTGRRKAIALRYDLEKDGAPKVVAKGGGHVGERILELAREHGIHIHEDADLVAVLSEVELNREIPPDLFKAVAEVLAFVYRLNQGLDSAK